MSDGPVMAAAALIGLFGVLLLWRGATWDPARGRVRCPRCWYSLKGLATLRCPECGHVAKSQRRCRKTRRRWSLVCSGTAAALFGIWSTGTIRSGSPAWVIPSTVLVLAGVDANTGGGPPHWRSWTLALGMRPWRVLEIELGRRFGDGRLAAWQYRRVVLRQQHLEPSALTGSVRARPIWPAGAPLFVDIKPDQIPAAPGGVVRTLEITPKADPRRGCGVLLSNGRVIDVERRLGFAPLEWGWTDRGVRVEWTPPADGVFRAEIAVCDLVPVRGTNRQRRAVVWREDVAWPLAPCESPADVITIDTDEATTQAIRESIRLEPAVIVGSGQVEMAVAIAVGFNGPRPEGLELAMVIEIECDGKVIGRGECRFHDGAGGDPSLHRVYLRGRLTRLREALDAREGRVTVRGDPLLALHNLRATRCWGGSFTVPLSEIAGVQRSSP